MNEWTLRFLLDEFSRLRLVATVQRAKAYSTDATETARREKIRTWFLAR
jgi:hypothetical protein